MVLLAAFMMSQIVISCFVLIQNMSCYSYGCYAAFDFCITINIRTYWQIIWKMKLVYSG